MIELDEAMRQALLARDGPPAGTSEQILAALRVRLGVPGPGGSGEGGGPEPSVLEPAVQQVGRAVWAAKIVGATAGLTGAGLLVLKVGALALAGIGADTSASDTQAQVEPQAPALVSVERAVEPPGADVEPASVASVPAADPGGLPASSRSSTMLAPDAKAADNTNPSSNLAAEIALLRDAKQLRATAPSAALDQLERHREQFPGGTLAPERDALRVELLCELGRVTQAATAREQFPITHPGSPLRARVEKACRGTDPEPSGE